MPGILLGAGKLRTEAMIPCPCSYRVDKTACSRVSNGLSFLFLTLSCPSAQCKMESNSDNLLSLSSTSVKGRNLVFFINCCISNT